MSKKPNPLRWSFLDRDPVDELLVAEWLDDDGHQTSVLRAILTWTWDGGFARGGSFGRVDGPMPDEFILDELASDIRALEARDHGARTPLHYYDPHVEQPGDCRLAWELTGQLAS